MPSANTLPGALRHSQKRRDKARKAAQHKLEIQRAIRQMEHRLAMQQRHGLGLHPSAYDLQRGA